MIRKWFWGPVLHLQVEMQHSVIIVNLLFWQMLYENIFEHNLHISNNTLRQMSQKQTTPEYGSRQWMLWMLCMLLHLLFYKL